MNIVSFLMGVNKKRKVDGFHMEAVLKETISREVTALESPRDSGYSLIDHVNINPRTVSITFANLDLIETWDRLNKILESRELISIVTGFDSFDNMMMTSLTGSYESRHFVKCDVEFTEVLNVEDINQSSAGSVTPYKG